MHLVSTHTEGDCQETRAANRASQEKTSQNRKNEIGRKWYQQLFRLRTNKKWHRSRVSKGSRKNKFAFWRERRVVGCKAPR